MMALRIRGVGDGFLAAPLLLLRFEAAGGPRRRLFNYHIRIPKREGLLRFAL